MNKNSDNKPNKWLILTQIPVQMGLTIYLFYRVGLWLDEKYHLTNEISKNSLTLLGVFVALYQVYSQVKKLNQ